MSSRKGRRHARKAKPRARWRLAALGITIFFIASAGAVWLILAGLEQLPVLGARGESPFSGKRAYEDLRKLVEIGPRPPGSKEAEATRAYIKRVLTEAGLTVREDPFVAQTPLGPRSMANVTGIVKGTTPDIVILGTHYDAKLFSFRFVGANDGGSTTAWMIEMGRALGARREGPTIWLCFFDGEEALKEWSETDSLYGSRRLVAGLKESGDVLRVKAMINVDMIGDCYLGIYRDAKAPAWLEEIVWGTARKLGYEEHFLAQPRSIEDDHAPFRAAGIPALELIDFAYGRSFLEHDQNWHTPHDTLEKVCPASLQAVGDVIYHALPIIDQHGLAAHPSP